MATSTGQNKILEYLLTLGNITGTVKQVTDYWFLKQLLPLGLVRKCISFQCRGNMPIDGIKNLSGRDDLPPVVEAAMNNHINTVNLLLDHGANIKLITRYDIRNLLRLGHVALVDLFLEKGFALSAEELEEDIWTAYNEPIHIHTGNPVVFREIQQKLEDYYAKIKGHDVS